MILNKIKFLESVLGKAYSSPSRYNDVLFKCIFCKHHKPKLSVNLDEDVDGNFGKYHCWVCDKKSISILYLLKRFNKYEAIKLYATHIRNSRWLDIDIEDENIENIELELPRGFTPLSSFSLDRNKNSFFLNRTADEALQYIKKERRAKNIDISSYLLGITVESKEYKNYIIIPSFDREGKLNYFTSRAFKSHLYSRYKNCNKDRTSIIFNEININWNEPLLLVEGPLDVIRADTNATCLLGSTLTKKSELLKKIVSKGTPIILCLDNDYVGKMKTVHIAKLLYEYGIDVKLLKLKKYKDIGEIEDDNEWKLIYQTQLSSMKNIDKFLLVEEKINSI